MQPHPSTDSRVQKSLLRTRLSQVTCIDSKKIELFNYRGMPIKQANCDYLIGDPEHDSVYGVWARNDPNDEVGSVVQRFTFSGLPLTSQDREQVDMTYQMVNAFPPNNYVKELSLVTIPESPFSALMCLTNHCKKDLTTCSSLGIYHISFDNNVRNRMRSEDFNCNYEFWEAVYSCASHTVQTIAIGCNGHLRLFTPEESSGVNNHNLLPLSKPNSNIKATSLKFSSTGQRLYCGSNQGHLFVYDVRNKSEIAKLSLRSKTVDYICALKDENQVIVSCHDHKLSLVDVRRMASPVLDYPGHVNNCRKIPVSVDESVGVMCSSGQDSRIRFWFIKTGNILCEMPVPTSEFFSPISNNYNFNHAWYSQSWKMLKGRPKPLIITAIQDKISVNSYLDADV